MCLGLSQKVVLFYCIMAFSAYSFFRALRLHPDKGGDPDLFKEVTHAYVVFSFNMFYLLLNSF